MIEHETHKPDDDDLVDRAAAALRDMRVPAGPSDGLLAGTLAAIGSERARERWRLNGQDTGDRTTSGRRLGAMNYAARLAIAAVLVLFVGMLVWTGGPWGGQPAFAEVLQKVNQVRSVRFKAVATVEHAALPPGAPKTQQMTMTIVGDRMRQDLPGSTVSIVDFRAGQMLALDRANKRAMRMTMENIPKEMKDQNILDRFRTMQGDKGKLVGRTELNGKPADEFRVEDDGQTMKVFADVETRLPVRMEASVNLPMMPKSEVVMSDFVWDVPVDEAAMSMDVPEGYDVQRLTMDMSPPSEKDLAQALAALAKLNGEQFPDTFDMFGLIKAITRLEAEGKRVEMKVMQEQMTQGMMHIGRAMMFITPKSGSDFRYAGKGAKLNQPDRPIFWYKPAGSETYHVLYADLSSRTGVQAAALPDLPTQQLLPSPQPATAPADPAAPR